MPLAFVYYNIIYGYHVYALVCAPLDVYAVLLHIFGVLLRIVPPEAAPGGPRAGIHSAHFCIIYVYILLYIIIFLAFCPSRGSPVGSAGEFRHRSDSNIAN